MKFIISMEEKSLKDELLKYFEVSADHPSNSSFNQRRAQLKSETFEHLFNEFSNHYKRDENLYYGYKLIACDGSDINIAQNSYDYETYFNHSNMDGGFNQLRVITDFIR